MSDLKAATHLLFLREDDLDQGLELLFYAARDLAIVPETPLAELGLGQSDYRTLSLVGRHPGLSMSELLGMLRMTKQSLSRSVLELQRAELVQQRAASHDRRQRVLELTARGSELERHLTRHLRARLARAYREAGGPAVEGFRQVLRLIVAAEDRRRAEQPPRGKAGDPPTTPAKTLPKGEAAMARLPARTPRNSS